MQRQTSVRRALYRLCTLLLTSAAWVTPVQAGNDDVIPPAIDGPQYHRWYTDDFIGPEDGQLWHTAFYLIGVRQEQLLKRHWGLLVRCTKAPIPSPLIVTFAFGSVLRTKAGGEIDITLKFDQDRAQRLPVISRNHANAEMTGAQARAFVGRSLSANLFRVSARLSPKGNGGIRIPLHTGRQVLAQLMNTCGIDFPNHYRPFLPSPSLPPSASAAPQIAARQNSEALTADPLTRSLAEYWQADSLAARRRAAIGVLANKPSFDELKRALTTTTSYVDPDAAVGSDDDNRSSLRGERRQDGVAYPYHLRIPDSYHPDISTPLYIYFHGGVNRPAWRATERWWQPELFDSHALVLSPASWRDAFWWHSNQQENLQELIIRMKRLYNIDDDRVYLVGVSDGGAGAFSVSSNTPTAFAGFASLIGHPAVLTTRRANLGSAPAFPNLANRPLFLLNGDSDPLYPPASLAPYKQRFKGYGVDFEAHVQKDTGHTINMPERVREQLREFFAQNPRASQRTQLYWETQPYAGNDRLEWLTIDAIHRGRERGCVIASYDATGFEVRTEGIERLTLLIPIDHPPEEPIQVRLNGRLQDFAPLVPSTTTLLKWHARDFDRTRLYAAELELEIKGAPAPVQSAQSAQSVCR